MREMTAMSGMKYMFVLCMNGVLSIDLSQECSINCGGNRIEYDCFEVTSTQRALPKLEYKRSNLT